MAKQHGSGKQLNDLQNENELLYAAINAAINGVIITNNQEPDNPIIYCNKAFEDLTGYTRDEIMGRNCRFLQKDDREQIERKQLKEAIADGKPVVVEIRNYRKNGTPFINELYVSPVKGKNGKVDYFVGIQNDVSQRKKLEVQLTNERRQLEVKVHERTKELEDEKTFQASIVSTIREGILVLDQNANVLSANEFFLKTFKVRGDEVIGRKLYELGNHQWDIPELRELLESVLPDNNPFEDFEVRHDFPNLGHRVMLLNARQIEYEGAYKNNVLLAIEDVTERFENEKRKDDFLSLASHELKTPITSIKGYAQIIQRILPKDNPKIADLFERIIRHVDHLTQLIADLLDVSTIKSGVVKIVRKQFDFDQIVRDAVEAVKPTTKTHKIEYEGASNVTITGDRVRIEQVITNLLTNAIKYSPESKSIVVYVSVVSDVVKLAVTDYGLGINIKDQERIFDRFYRVEETQKAYPGLGIGLYFCKQVIELHKGHLWVDSELGTGSTFSFTLPINSDKKV